MKTLLAALACAAALALPAASGGVPIATDHVLINEVMPNAPGSSELGFEWLELYNPTAVDVDVSAWILTDLDTCNFKPGDYALPAASVVPSLGYLEIVLPAASNVCLANSGDDLTLRDALGNVVDAAWYGNGGDYGPDGAAPAPPESRSIARCYLLAGSAGPALDHDVPATEFYVENEPSAGGENDACLPSL